MASAHTPDNTGKEAMTWADRNPSKEVQSIRSRHELSDAQKATKQLGKVHAQQKQEQLSASIDKYLLEGKEAVKNLADAHDVKIDYIKKLVDSKSLYKKTRAPSLPNAIAHFKATEVNKDLAVGEKMGLVELKRLAEQDAHLQDLSDVEKAELIAALLAYREKKKSGTRASNRSAAQDVRFTVERINEELDKLSERTGVYAITFITRSHVDDTASPSWFGSGDSMDFFREVLDLDPWDVVRQFEQWACAREKDGDRRDTLASIRAECTKLILAGLRYATKKKVVMMNYVNYERAVVERYQVKLIGWTHKSFVNPSEIGAMDDIRKLRAALKCGSCHWVRLSRAEFKEHISAVEERQANGEIIGKKRKGRTDKGIARKRVAMVQDRSDDGRQSSDGSDNDIDNPPVKKKKTGTQERKSDGVGKAKGNIAAGNA